MQTRKAASVEVALGAASWEGVDTNAQALVDRWLVSEGTHVAAGDVLARVVLVKATLEVTAPAPGVVEQILVPAGENFSRSQALAQLRPD
ncbi:MAG TPA: lipoyl domain-containing protein [Ramlibacter sp.]|nr:lipoyl domain-containing protein [Ramlibacter sp.]